ncbi:alpha/beta hydrolase [Aquabacterium sp. A7-Y]|uniref:alpha/beta fold hydrolase n=1 Tax=Aquabacterium sp. A7-Y TaxID=1349605 RepID=UPI00223D6F51|nr:alpha/beta hydrolase [Aquabacterium sp. A7-Y]MCW7537373.1 alpha/beta hydrolase [Aquabacterium sp. A7-Y]
MESRPALVLLHGLLGSLSYFSPSRHLPGLDTFTPDLLGYGANAGASPGSPLSLELQAQFVGRYLREQVGRPSWVLGHSVGGAVAMEVARLAPDRVLGVISVEGNFTLNDAFWCRGIAPLAEEEWAAQYRRLQGDPKGWLERSGVEVSPERLSWAEQILQNQPPETVQGMARAVVRETALPGYLEGVREVVERGTPLHLLAGERSVDGWDVPGWVKAAARSATVLPGTGHMMMLEAPAAFCAAIQAAIEA